MQPNPSVSRERYCETHGVDIEDCIFFHDDDYLRLLRGGEKLAQQVEELEGLVLILEAELDGKKQQLTSLQSENAQLKTERESLYTANQKASLMDWSHSDNRNCCVCL